MGVYFAQARLYDAANKRFVQTDPIGGNVARPVTLNAYLYCIDDPVNHIDPTGMYMPGDENRSPEQQAAIAVQTDAWNKANATGDKAGMDAAHAAAEAIRNGTGATSGGGNSAALDEWYKLTEGLPSSPFSILVENIAQFAPALSFEEVLFIAAQWTLSVDRQANPTTTISLNGSSNPESIIENQITPLSVTAVFEIAKGFDILSGGLLTSALVDGIIYIWGGTVASGGVLSGVIYVISGDKVEVEKTIISRENGNNATESEKGSNVLNAKGTQTKTPIPAKLKDGDKVKTPDTHPGEFVKGSKGVYTHKKTGWKFKKGPAHGGEHWDVSPPNGNYGDYYNVTPDGRLMGEDSVEYSGGLAGYRE